MYQDEDVAEINKNPEWMPVRHSDKHLIELNCADKTKKEILWAVSKSYTYRFLTLMTELTIEKLQLITL